MGLVNKLKNILFEEEEVEIPVIEKEKKPVEYKELPKKEEHHENYNDFFEKPVDLETKEEVKNMPPKEEISEREIFKSEKTFNFPAFDEDEFEQFAPRRSVINREIESKKIEPKKEFRKIERKEEKVEVKTKFRPSPIISPVYGILDKNYTPDDITTRDNKNAKTLDVDSVRKKAFGTLTEQKTIKPNDTKEDPINDEAKILEEKLEKARTIDELLKDSSDEIIELDNKDNKESLNNETYEDIDSLENIEPKHEEVLEDDTLENDLFDLIDSMYENREDGE